MDPSVDNLGVCKFVDGASLSAYKISHVNDETALGNCH